MYNILLDLRPILSFIDVPMCESTSGPLKATPITGVPAAIIGLTQVSSTRAVVAIQPKPALKQFTFTGGYSDVPPTEPRI